MRKIAALAGLALVVPGPVQAETLRVGFVATLTGGVGILGRASLNGLRLGLEHEGWKKNGDKLGGVPMNLYIGDAQAKPDVALRAARRMMQSDRVQVITGLMLSNVMLAVYRPAIRARRIVLSSNAGPSNVAGKDCSIYFTGVSHQNDQWGETLGLMATQDGVKRVYTMAPNYQAGKDMVAGFRRHFKGGKEIGGLLYTINQTDFQADISKLRAEKPEALFVFAPGGMGISFTKQWGASGAGKDIRLYALAAVDHLTIKAIGDAAMGVLHNSNWDASADNPVNQRFVKDYVARYKQPPAFYAATGYDTARLLAAAVKKVGGKVDDTLALAKALRKTPFPSVRGTVTFNVNGMPIQDWYKQTVVAGPDGTPLIKTTGVIAKAFKDSYWQKCSEKNR